jgi:hypothetical protein
MSRFKITNALWDRINHFAAFPQTGGEAFVDRLSCTGITENTLTSSLTPADGPIRPEPLSRNLAESIPILIGRTTNKTLASYSGIGRSSRWTE